ncbi:hypothetical protein NTE_02990 [Candidatus Nitrososphaera evergladensis SR1]|uniref:Uncharacterized protein n=1 Tax=Candidatus Nitrososphaera evergladensis SR1 TaxID=1459636 RepID=A0A075MUY1_9ARCH|nr:hypothetical protein [Candidatus Nitrososphaera evergladensis]AIF85025.1 hypothetical protein NTE_02990 [Candidatus Nitrososphaera evergladensis SR1]
MTGWLRVDEQAFSGGVEHLVEPEYYNGSCALSLLKVRILETRKLFGATDVILYSIVVNGLPDMKSGTPFWSRQDKFPQVKKGATLSIDPDLGVLLFRGRPQGFLNLYLVAVRDTEETRQFAQLLKENFVAKGIGTIAGSLIQIFSGPTGPVTVPLAREATTQAVEATIDYFAKQKNLAIGVYYASLIREKNYGLGYHPNDYPDSMINCDGHFEVAYEVQKAGE